MMTAGLIGLTRLYEDDLNLATETGITLTEEHLSQFAERYIHWMIQEFSIVERDVGRMQWAVKQANNAQDSATDDEKVKQQTTKVQDSAKQIRKSISEQAKKVEKYFASTTEYADLLQLIDRLDQLSKDSEALSRSGEIKQAVDQYKQIMSVAVINEKLTLNYVKAVIMGSFFGQTSILQPTFNAKSKQQHIEQLNKDFAQPALRELQLYGELHKPIEVAEIATLLQTHSETYKPFKDWFRTVKKLTDKQAVYDFFRNEVLPCSLITGMPSTQSYEEMTFSPLALSKKNAVNFNWDFDKNTPFPISALARLILFAVPIGLAVYNRRMGTEEFNESKRFFGMVLSQTNFIENVKNNNTYRTLRKGGNTMEEAITNLLTESQDKAEKLHKYAYFFIELHSEYQAKKTLLEYYHMPPYLAVFLSKFGKTLHRIHHANAKDAFLRTVLKGLDPKETVYELLRMSIKPKMSNPNATDVTIMLESQRLAESAFFACRARKRILQAKKGADQMTNDDKKISHVYYQGVNLRNRLVANRPGEQGENNVYRAGGRKKLEGIAYRLLNASKSGDKTEFMDTVFRVYMSANTSTARQNSGSDNYMEVSSIFLEGFKQDGLDFDTITTAFIAGLLGQKTTETTEDNKIATPSTKEANL